MMKQSKNLLKIVVVGDNKVGKTTLIRWKTSGSYQDLTGPSEVFYPTSFSVDSKLSLAGFITDCPSGSDYTTIRSCLYKNAKVILVCYSVDDELSFFHVVRKWVPEITKHQSRIPFILVGTKSDLVAKISTNEGKQLAEKLHAAAFLECSSKDGTGIKEVFTTALNIYTRSFAYKRRNKRPCNIM
ncbi:GTP-binding protein RHO1-like isoform X1 [Photinus pyralis]|uniref:GTP-binding protein RHO1-like isoform X1 n=1 Tax=Photinus pyralis TaxID=7054 RepID=UPI001266EB47|nr:GTP-binding protein RHO1-like isoform X1 [Photinus pyralis]XP_031334233.1 GTP-binding protein RHO1-like isoform X1 [Photinus pyralis]XP_031348916.1 GTP-binding protein RHO1-like isoform X1 [Photinus pyralis]